MRGVFGTWLTLRLLTIGGGSRYARQRLIRSALLIAMVMIPLVLSLIFMDGMMRGITDKYITLQDGHIQLQDPALLDATLLTSDPRIRSADYVVSGFGIMYSRDATAEVRIKGVGDSYFNAERSAQLEFTGPMGEREGSVVPVMLSHTIARQLGVEIGQRVAFMVVPDSSTRVVRPVLAKVTSLYSSGYHELDSSLIFMNVEDALRYFPAAQNAYTELLVTPEGTEALHEIAMEAGNRVERPLPYATWDEFNGTVYQNFVTSRQVILLVFLMILLVAGVYVSSVAQEMVQDSTNSIALYKTLGAHHGVLLRSYFLVIIFITAIGMAIGTAGGVAIGTQLGTLMQWLAETGIEGLQYYLLDFPVVISWRDIALICFVMLVISSLTVKLSLGRIKKISPLELLQQD